MTNYAFVIDYDNKPLSPTKTSKAWYMIRKKKAMLVSKYPMVIRLNRVIPENDICKDEVRMGIDDGSEHVGIALIQKCQTKNKVLFKGTIEHRKDVKKLMAIRRGYRQYHRYHKRYRPKRFNNRKNSKRQDRIAPSIFQKRQAIMRVVNHLRKWSVITSFWLEDVAIDTRALTDGYKLYRWQYQQSNRLDENLRKATILRDKNTCKLCGKSDCKLEVHHITPKRLNGSNTVDNLITLCPDCHKNITGNEEQYANKLYSLIQTSKTPNLAFAQHVMIGKKWLRTQLNLLAPLCLTTGGDTANKRIDWNIEKSHANDAICITDLRPDTYDLKDWTIKPIRRQSKAKTDNVLGIKHHDLVSYTYRNGEKHVGYVTALYPDKKQLNFQSLTKHCKRVNATKCRLLWSFNKLYWL